MKKSTSVILLATLLGGCASSQSGALPDGAYQLIAYDAGGNQVGKKVEIDIPFNDPSFAIGAACMNESAVKVVFKDRAGNAAAERQCARR